MTKSALVPKLAEALGPGSVLTAPEALAPFVKDERGRFEGRALCLALPRSTAEASFVVRLCQEAGVPMVPQGGNSGLCGGATPFESGQEVLINLSRMKALRASDAQSFTLTVEAGMTLLEVQQQAAKLDRYFPLSLGAEGTCQIGGNLSTNAGGIHVLRYGNARDLVLGLEVVLPTGEIWDGLRSLRKDNRGYDLKHLFIGAEGTLGIITAAALKLFPRPLSYALAYVAVPNPAAAVTLLSRLRAASGDQVSACEIMARQGLDFAYRHVTGLIDPFAAKHPWYLIVELSSSAESGGLEEILAGALERAAEDGLLIDATIAASEQQRQEIWKLREAIVWAQRPEGASLKHDVAVPLSSVAQFIDEGLQLVAGLVPGIRPVPFGHIGDGNLHFNLTKPLGMEDVAFHGERERVSGALFALADRFGGTFSAEHGVGRLRLGEMARFKAPLELEMMRTLKRAFDPKGLMNPGKVIV